MRKIILPILLLALCLALLGVLSACGASPVGIAVTKNPTTKTVPQGGVPDLTGGIVTVTYGDDTTKEIPMSELEQRGLNTDELGKQTLVLVYTEGKKSFSTTLEVTVALAKAKSLELSTEQLRTHYFTGESFDRSGLVVTAYYETGKSAEVTSYEVAPTRMTLGTTSVTVTYRSARAEIPVTVEDRAPASLEFTTNPTKMNYYVGDAFSSEGLTAKVLYNDGTSESFAASALTYSHPMGGGEYLAPSSVEDKVVRVTAHTALGDVYADLTLTVSEVLPVEMVATVTEGELSFLEEDRFSFGTLGNVSVYIRYNNGRTETVVATDDVFFAGEGLLEPGQTNVEITLGDYAAVKATVPITVRPITVESISILVAPSVTEYAAGDTVDLTGLILLVTKSNRDVGQLPYSEDSGITCDPVVVTAETAYVTVTYQERNAIFYVEVA